MGQKAKEPNVAEFISALAAGNNAQLMVVACASAADSTTLALVAAAHQTGGQVVCIVPGHKELKASKNALGIAANQVQFMVGEAQELLSRGRKQNGTVVVGYNAFSYRGSCGSKTQLLPIGKGLLVTKFGVTDTSPRYGTKQGRSKAVGLSRLINAQARNMCSGSDFLRGK
ncbi:hypothetical protein SESBI_46862 [Sesbania bispinosa]|nr:hypothetical protein SESBI_46862 [Sesbania bispinosa]